MFSRKPAPGTWPSGRTTRRIGARCKDFSVTRVLVCDGSWSRMRGLLLRPEGTSALLFPCASVHTIGMRHNLDVIYLSADRRVVRIVRDLKPLRASFGPSGCYAVLELPAGAGSRLQVGDELEWVSEEMQA